MKAALTALALTLMPVAAHADELPDPPKKDDGGCAGAPSADASTGLGLAIVAGAGVVAAALARRRGRA